MPIGQRPSLCCRVPRYPACIFLFPLLICYLDILFENVNLLANTSDLNAQILQKNLLLSRVPLLTVFSKYSVKIRHMFNYFTFPFSHSEEAMRELGPADRLSVLSCFSFPRLSHTLKE